MEAIFWFQTVDIIYLDFFKAFNTVSHSILLKEAYYDSLDKRSVC